MCFRAVTSPAPWWKGPRETPRVRAALQGRAGRTRVPRVGLDMVGHSQGEIPAEELSRRGGPELSCP